MGNLVYHVPPTILIVEDGNLSRDPIRKISLETEFKLFVESNAGDTLSIMATTDIDLMVVDTNLLSVANSIHILREARKIKPALLCIFVFECFQPIEYYRDIDEFISKPFHSRELAGCIWKVLLGNHSISDIEVAKRD